jgi:hypothetical protein
MRVDYDKDQLAYALANALKERDEAREKAERYRLDANALMLQRDEAREKIERQADIGCSFQKTNPAMCGRYKQERDEAREKYATEATEHMLAVNKLCNERDDARENLDEEMKFHHRTHRELIETQCKLLDMDLKREETLDEIKRLKVILDLIKKDVS